MRQFFHQLTLRVTRRGLVDFTSQLQGVLRQSQLQDGIMNLLLQHTSASLLIQENADPDVRRDLDMFFSQLVMDGDPRFMHRAEGDDDMAAHIRTALTSVHLAIPFQNGQLSLGTWQGVYLWEHRTHAHARKILIHCLGT